VIAGRLVLCFLLIATLTLAAGPVVAQDQGLDPVLYSSAVRSSAVGSGAVGGGAVRAGEISNVDAHGVLLYRLPFAFHLRSLDEHPWGLRVTFPLSLSAIQIENTSDVGSFVKKLAIVAVVPGVELELPVGDRVLLRPFVEAGVGRGSDGGDVEVLYGAGWRGRIVQPIRRLRLTAGGAAIHKRAATNVRIYDDYSIFEAGADVQVPLGFSIRQKAARGGVYTIARAFAGLEIRREGQPPIVLDRQFEVGGSFATGPDLRVWKITLPWIAAGYQFGEVVSGVRVYTTFPF
jgi:hypothetical protein